MILKVLILLPESVVRASPSKEAVTLAFQSLRHKNRISAQNLYKKLVLSSYGTTKFEPLSDKKFSKFATFISDTYELNKESLVTYQPLCGKSSDICYGSFNKSASTFDSLSDSVSPHVNRVDSCLKIAPMIQILSPLMSCGTRSVVLSITLI